MTIIKPAPPAGKPGKSSVGVVVPFEDKHPEKNASIERLVSLVASDMERVNAMILSRTGSEVTSVSVVKDSQSGSKMPFISQYLLPDVAVLDARLPDGSGIDVCRELRRNPAFADTLIIAQTGWGQDRDREGRGADEHASPRLVELAKRRGLLSAGKLLAFVVRRSAQLLENLLADVRLE